jgi:hypothetical protein
MPRPDLPEQEGPVLTSATLARLAHVREAKGAAGAPVDVCRPWVLAMSGRFVCRCGASVEVDATKALPWTWFAEHERCPP